jgi:hypothetical protein
VPDLTTGSSSSLGVAVGGGELPDPGPDPPTRTRPLDYGDAYWMGEGGWHPWTECAG